MQDVSNIADEVQDLTVACFMFTDGEHCSQLKCLQSLNFGSLKHAVNAFERDNIDERPDQRSATRRDVLLNFN